MIKVGDRARPDPDHWGDHCPAGEVYEIEPDGWARLRHADGSESAIDRGELVLEAVPCGGAGGQ